MSKRPASSPAAGPPARLPGAILFRYFEAFPDDIITLVGEMLDRQSNRNLRFSSQRIYQRLLRGAPGNMMRRWRLPRITPEDYIRLNATGVPYDEWHRTSDRDFNLFVDRFWDPRGGDTLDLSSMCRLSDFARLAFANVIVSSATDPAEQMVMTTAPWARLSQSFRAFSGQPFADQNNMLHPHFVLAPNTTSLMLEYADDTSILPQFIGLLQLESLKVFNHYMVRGAPLRDGTGRGVFAFNGDRLRVFHFDRYSNQEFNNEGLINQTLVAKFPYLEELSFTSTQGETALHPEVLQLQHLKKLVLRGCLAESPERGALTWAGSTHFPTKLEVLELRVHQTTHLRDLLQRLREAPNLKRLVLVIVHPNALPLGNWIPESLEHLEVVANLEADIALHSLPNLKTLILVNKTNHLSRIIDTSGGMPQLQRLQLTNFSSAGPLRGSRFHQVQ